MKSPNWLGIALFTIVAATVGYAQSPGRVQAEVPFDFCIGRTTFPAGQYVLGRASGPGVISIEGRNSKTGMSVFASPGYRSKQEDKTQLIFHRYGDRYFLSSIWYAGESDGFELPKSKAERELAKVAKANASPSEEVVLVASAR